MAGNPVNVDHSSTVFQVFFYPRMLQCLLKEWRHSTAKHGIRSAKTIFFGGGTPSLMPLRLIETLVKEISGETEVGTMKSIKVAKQSKSAAAQFLKSLKQNSNFI